MQTNTSGKGYVSYLQSDLMIVSAAAVGQRLINLDYPLILQTSIIKLINCNLHQRCSSVNF